MVNGLMGAYFFSLLAVSIGFILNPLFSQTLPDTLRLNQIRVLASHNSYKIQPTPRTMKFINRFRKVLGEENQPFQLAYSHRPLSEQLSNYSIRGFELDVYNDPKGGRYYKHRLNFFIPKQRIREAKYRRLKDPGFKIIHIPDIDYQTNYLFLKDALDELNHWSIANPRHSPVFVNIELKGRALGNEAGILRLMGFKKAIPFDQQALIAMDDLFKSTLLTMYTPKDFLNGDSSLQDRITNQGWPTINEVRGRIFVIVQGSGLPFYPKTNQGAFIYGEVSDPNCIFLLRDDPTNTKQITALLDRFIIRTRTDAGTIEARNNDYSRLYKALESGAQILSTDYYTPDPTIGPFVIPFKGFIGD